MNEYIWLFPVLFIFHDFEEIIGFGLWYKRNSIRLKNRFPKITPIYEKMFTDFSTEGAALAIFEELIVCIAICLCAYNIKFYGLWVGAFIGFILHLIMHIVQGIIWKGYIPALATSIITAPISMIILIKVLKIVRFPWTQVILWSMTGLLLIIINLKFAHVLMHRFTRWMNK